MEIDHLPEDHLFIFIIAVKVPFVGCVGVVQVGDGAVGGDGVDIIVGIRGPQFFQIGFVVVAVSRDSQQGGQSPSRAGAVGNNPFRVSRESDRRYSVNS